jgi:neurofibromin 1
MQDQSKSWQNLTFFLASTISTCMYDASPPPSLSHIVGKGILPRVYEEHTDARTAAEGFIRECVDLLVSHSVHVRETIKEALGAELPASMSKILVAQMSKWVSWLHASVNGIGS